MPPFGRRAFLRRSLNATAAFVAAPLLRIPSSRADQPDLPQPCPSKAWQKLGVVLEPTESWEGEHIQNFTSPSEVLRDGWWRIWYSAVDERQSYTVAYAEGELGGPLSKVPVQCTSGAPADAPLALGGLPPTWRPVHVTAVRLRSGKHRLYFWVHADGVLRYLAADSDDGRRYTVIDPLRPVLYHFHDRAAHGVASPDGVCLHPKPSRKRPADEPPAASHLICNDATTIYQLPNGSFELYAVGLIAVSKDDPAYVAHDNAPGLLRVVDRLTSEDGLRFGNRRRVIQRDSADPSDLQFYHLAVTHTPRGRVGLLGHYRVRAQTMDLEWCLSSDGLTWHRPRRSAWLARGDPGQPDSYGIYAPHSLVHSADRWHLLYTGVNTAHNGRHSHGPPRTVVMHATTGSIWA